MTPLLKKKPQEIFKKASKTIEKHINNMEYPESTIDLTNDYRVSESTLSGYVTLNFEHRTCIKTIIDRIESYVVDQTRERPLNIIMIAGPGSGKSHLVKCIAKKLSQIGIAEVSYNMATLQHPADLSHPIGAIRNYKVRDNMPILFLDECDTCLDNLALLLPMMWDGGLNVGSGVKKIGKSIIILAASTKVMMDTIKHTQRMEQHPLSTENADKKIIDFLSRINGGTLEIPDLEGKNRLANKACIGYSLISSRFGKSITTVPLSIIKFIAITKFRYGTRSIAHLVDLIPKNAVKGDKILANKLRERKLPITSIAKLIESGLAYHLFDENNDPNTIINNWKKFSKTNTLLKFM